MTDEICRCVAGMIRLRIYPEVSILWLVAAEKKMNGFSWNLVVDTLLAITSYSTSSSSMENGAPPESKSSPHCEWYLHAMCYICTCSLEPNIEIRRYVKHTTKRLPNWLRCNWSCTPNAHPSKSGSCCIRRGLGATRVVFWGCDCAALQAT